jgi:hypothetical protein
VSDPEVPEAVDPDEEVPAVTIPAVHPTRPKTKMPENATRNSEPWCFIDLPNNRSVFPAIVRDGMWACVEFDLPERTRLLSARMRRSSLPFRAIATRWLRKLVAWACISPETQLDRTVGHALASQLRVVR